MTDYLAQLDEHIHRAEGAVYEGSWAENLLYALRAVREILRTLSPPAEAKRDEPPKVLGDCPKCAGSVLATRSPILGRDVYYCTRCQASWDDLPRKEPKPEAPGAELADGKDCPHRDECCQNEPCTGPGNPDMELLVAMYDESGTDGEKHEDSLAEIWELGKGHGYHAGIEAGRASLAAELAAKDQRIAELEAKLAAWEPAIRCVLEWRKNDVDPEHKPDACMCLDTLADLLDAIPPEHRTVEEKQ